MAANVSNPLDSKATQVVEYSRTDIVHRLLWKLTCFD